MTDYKLLINGKLVAGDAEIDVINPCTEEVLAKAPRASENQLNEAVAAAKAAFPAWSATPVAERRAMVAKIAEIIDANSDEFVRLLSQEVGRPLHESKEEVWYTAEFLRGMIDLDLPDTVLHEDDEGRVIQRHRPLGVVGAIIPWNYPILLTMFKAPFALLAGNTVVVKPAPSTPLATLRLGELLADVFPAGVFNIVTDANDLGPKLTAHPDVAKITFTGSSQTGPKILNSASATMKRVTMELGGNDAAIIMPDVDLDKVADFMMYVGFSNAGQICNCVKRVYAHADIYDVFVDKLVERVKNFVLGDALEQGTTMGPIHNKAQFERAKLFLADAHKNGTIVAGGEVLDRPGYFIQPTLVANVTDGTMIVDEEQFAPILPVIKFTDIEEVLKRANNSPFGLSGSIWTKDLEFGYSVASRIEAGTTYVNDHGPLLPTIAFAGAKTSGYGCELGVDGLAEFTQRQVVFDKKVVQWGHAH